jgi:hypothetical protein
MFCQSLNRSQETGKKGKRGEERVRQTVDNLYFILKRRMNL